MGCLGYRDGAGPGGNNRRAQAAAAAADPAPIRAAVRNPTTKFSVETCRANTNPSKAVAIRPAMRATALLKPEAIPTCLASTDAMTLVVSGATHAPIPKATSNV